MYLFIYANRKLQLNAGYLKELYLDSKLKENGLYPEINFYRKLKGGQAFERRNDGGVYRSGGMERRIHSGIYWRTVPKPEAEERFKEEKEPVHKRGELWE